ncbi:MAG: glycosyltransferase family 2 protein [Fimbriimonadaceae bacterium]|nr:glycosyltransferase family 2 protein [Fimbriimonadaceae bacterium]
MKPTISVVIVSWNTAALTCAAVRSVLQQEVAAELDVIVVDNASRDDTVTRLRAEFPTVRVIQTGRNLGFAGGNNVGLRRVRGAYTLLLNSDARLRPGALQTLLATAQALPAAAALQPLLHSPDGSLQYCWDYQPSLWSELWLVLWQRRRVASAGWQQMVRRWRAPRRVRAVGLAALFLPSWVWGRIGGLTTATFLFFEEADLSARLVRAGWPLYLVPAAAVDHDGGCSTGQVPLLKRRAHYLSRLWYYRHHTPRWQSAVLRAVTLLRAAWGRGRGGAAATELWQPVWQAALRGDS